MKITGFAIICYICLEFIISSIDVAIATDSLRTSQNITSNDSLISPGNKFELGFFNIRSSSKFYFGIWYKDIPNRTYVWIANRDNPLDNTSSAHIRIGNDGNLILLDKTERIVWSTSIANPSSRNTSVHLLDSGNLVLRDEVQGSVLWQSFDHPTHTIVPGMKLGWDLNTNVNRNLTSWKSLDDPSVGEYTYMFDLHGLPQLVILKGTSKRFRSGPWNGIHFGGLGLVHSYNFPFTFEYIANSDEVYFAFSVKNGSSPVMVDISYLGTLQTLIWDVRVNNWRLSLEFPEDGCGDYGRCGRNSVCTISNALLKCECLIGYIPVNMQEGSGCVRNSPFNCSVDEEFEEVNDVKLPDFFELKLSLSMEECRELCLKNCSCTAYANSDVTTPGHGCILWFGELIDIRKLSENAEQKLYIRIRGSDRESKAKKSKKMIIIVVVITVLGLIVLLLAVFIFIRKRKSKQGRPQESQNTDKDRLELPCFDIATLTTATQKFSDMNIIGRGGFGPVYKGVLLNGQHVAVKRLSKNSSQGLDELKNEVKLIAKLQHRNLVRLLGCCIEEDERILIYEYMDNGSLDSYIFGSNGRKTHLLVWRRRFSIIVGIARGLLYLHRDSRLTIIHRDLKASNILLDTEMNPKISDFGMARTFGEAQAPTMTKRIVGTFGYMSPEYATRGIFSMKSDVFSFGVLVLEIVNGQRNSQFHHPDHDLSLLGHAWNLWNEGRSVELMDPLMEDSLPFSEVLRCIQVGLLCVQQRPEDRPIMASVLLMLDSETAVLPQPKRPGFWTGLHDENKVEGESVCTSNEEYNSMVEGR